MFVEKSRQELGASREYDIAQIRPSGVETANKELIEAGLLRLTGNMVAAHEARVGEITA
jgi:hypothetical protein